MHRQLLSQDVSTLTSSLVTIQEVHTKQHATQGYRSQQVFSPDVDMEYTDTSNIQHKVEDSPTLSADLDMDFTYK